MSNFFEDVQVSCRSDSELTREYITACIIELSLYFPLDSSEAILPRKIRVPEL